MNTIGRKILPTILAETKSSQLLEWVMIVVVVVVLLLLVLLLLVVGDHFIYNFVICGPI